MQVDFCGFHGSSKWTLPSLTDNSRHEAQYRSNVKIQYKQSSDPLRDRSGLYGPCAALRTRVPGWQGATVHSTLAVVSRDELLGKNCLACETRTVSFHLHSLVGVGKNCLACETRTVSFHLHSLVCVVRKLTRHKINLIIQVSI
jgi:hypothetical protein